MSKKPIVALIYDFDSTLASMDMQNFTFIPALGMKPEEFWAATGEFSQRTGTERTLSYMYMMIKIAKEKGIHMTKEWLRECGKNVTFFPGVLDWFRNINEYGASQGVKIEHYIISSGNKEILEGTAIANEFKQIYGCEFLFDKNGEPIWPKLCINYTQKTQYFFRIAKGAFDATDDKSVNEKKDEKRIPYSNIIYVGDGMTDIPAMIIAKNNGGKSIAVYPRGMEDKVEGLFRDGRVNYRAPADYRDGKEFSKIVKLIIQGVAINEALGKKENRDTNND